MDHIEILLLLSLLPSIVLGIMVYKKDTVEKEPKSLLFKLFIGGIGAVILTIAISFCLNPILPEIDDGSSTRYLYIAINTFFKVALVEEYSKWFILKKLTWSNKNFNYIYDAIVYAVFVSLGFATIENILYVCSDDGGFSVAILRAILSVPGHAFNGVFMGYYYGMAKQALINNNFKLVKKNLLLSLLIPIVAHFIFDYLLLVSNVILLVIYLIFVVFLYINAFKRINQFSKITDSLEDTNNIEVLDINQNDNLSKPRYCSNCGSIVESNFCSVCGKKVE